MALTLRVLAATLMFVVLLLPQGRASADEKGSSQGARFERVPALSGLGPAAASSALISGEQVSLDEGGSCGESEESEELVIDCGAQLDRNYDEPVVIGLLRELGLEMDREACDQLLRDIYAELSCEGRGPDCGQLHSGAPPAPGPKLGMGSASAQSTFSELELGADQGRRRALERARPLRSRSLPPPVPPPQ